MFRIVVIALLTMGLTPISAPAASQDVANNRATAPAPRNPLSFTAPTFAYPGSIWSAADVPAKPAETDGAPIEVGVKFRTDVDGYITGLRFYKGAANTGEHVGHLWQANGTLLAEAIFAGETDSGWQQVALAAPVAVQANTTYVASYFSPSGYFAIDAGYFATTGKDNPPLHALASGVDGPNGVFHSPTGESGFPAAGSSYNYWVDVLFVATDTTPPIISDVTAAPNISTATITWTTDEAANSRVDYGIAADALTLSASGAALVLNHSLTLSGLTPNTTYYYRVTSQDAAYNAATAPATGDPLSFTTLTFPSSIWSAADVPAKPAETDGAPIEVGVKFRTDVDGYITGLRFYKGAANTGEHVGHLWQANGTLLAEAIFAGETDSGWQQVALAAPVAVQANTTYVASYFSPSGYFAIDAGYFATTGKDNPPLHALASGVDGPNGVFHSPTGESGFPASGSFYNYWVDVLFDVPPVKPVVSIKHASPGVELWWQRLTANTSYEVWRGATPNFNPDPEDLPLATVPSPTTGLTVTYPDATAVNGNFFYFVRGVNASGQASATSDRVGVFRFPLVPGS